MPFILDTNILINYVRGSVIWSEINNQFFKNRLKHHARTSIVSVAEMEVFARRNNWNKEKLRKTAWLLKNLNPININDDIVQKYIQIDLYSQNKHKSLRLPSKYSARNMGKNDIWIAATAAAYRFPLLTTDKDFEHLNQVFIDVVYIDIHKILNQ